MKSRSGLRALLPAAIGARMEQSTEAHLRAQGLETLARNFRCRAGEIDLVMTDGDMVVFVEVRYRSRNAWGGPLESITPAKQRRVVRAAEHFLARHPHLQQRPCRFDAVGVQSNDGRVSYDWIKGAFST